MANDIVTVWGGVPRIGRSPVVGDLLIGNGSSQFILGGGANDNTGISQPTIGGDNMEVTTVGGVTQYGFAGYHGEFQSHQNQTLTGAGVTALVTYNTTNLSYGVSVVSNTKLTVANPGVYNFQFSAQIVSPVNNRQAYIWLKKNGSDVAYSNTEIDLTNKDYGYVAAWNFLTDLAAGGYVELAWTSNDGGTILRDGAAAYGPNIPSVIATVCLVR